MRCLVTGAAGFVGSSLAARLADLGHDVRAVDCFTDYYAESQKRENQRELLVPRGLTLIEADLAVAPLDDLLEGVEVVFHQAGQPGVRASWDHGFERYVQLNVLVTQRLLEATKQRGSIRRFVFASSSSVYGNDIPFPTREDALPRPHSPYGVTKLAAEHLCSLYARNFGVPTVSLRYFTVYGPRQRPDMAMHRLIEAAMSGTDFPLFGDGRQRRDFTFIHDVVAANISAATTELTPGEVLNICAGGSTSMLDVISIVNELLGQTVAVEWLPVADGDVARTGGDNTRARELLLWAPTTGVDRGLAAQVSWHLHRRTSQNPRSSPPSSGSALGSSARVR